MPQTFQPLAEEVEEDGGTAVECAPNLLHHVQIMWHPRRRRGLSGELNTGLEGKDAGVQLKWDHSILTVKRFVRSTSSSI